MNNGRCRRCGKSLAGHRSNAVYCSQRCQRQWRTAGGAPLRATDTDVLVERRKLEGAAYACRRCTCERPLGLVDETGEARCFKCGWPLVRDEVGLPPGDVPTAA